MINQQQNKFDLIIELLLYALLAFMPLAFGAVHAWSEEVVIIISAVMMLLFSLKLIFNRELKFIWTWGYLPVALFIFIVVFQLIRFPVEFIETISLHTAKLKTELLNIIPNSNAHVNSMTLSFYPYATIRQLRLVLAIACLFIVVVNIFRTPEQIKRLLLVIAVIAGGIALLTIAQVVTASDKIYWLFPTPFKLADAGPFVNHSNYSQFMNLSVGAILGLLFVKLHEAFTGQKITALVVMEYFESRPSRRIWLLVAAVVLGITSVFVSLSRGGVISMLIAGAFTTLVLSSRRSLKGRSWIMALMVLGAFICVLYIGFDAVYDRLATLRDLHQYESRWQMFLNILVEFKQFPLFGTGLGTYSVIYPMYDNAATASLAVHAENEYTQCIAETGFLGFGVLMVFGSIVCLAFLKCIRSVRKPVCSAAYGLGFGLIAILIHSLSDFGQHLPANASLSVIFCALLISLAQSESSLQLPPAINSVRKKRVAGIFCVTIPAMALIWFTFYPGGADNARIAEAHWKKVLTAETALMEKNWQGSNEEYIEIIYQAAAASDLQPDNVHYRHWLNVYRWQSINRMRDSDTGRLVIPDELIEVVPRIIDDFYKAITICPTFGPSWCVAGQLKGFILNNTSGSAMIQEGYRLAPCNPTTCFVAGKLDAIQALEEAIADAGSLFDPNTVISVPDSSVLLAASEKLNRSVELDHRFFGQVCSIYIDRLNRPDLAITLAGSDMYRLNHVANILDNLTGHDEPAKELRLRVFGLLKTRSQEPDAPAWIFASLANIYRKQNAYTEAMEYYRHALVRDYGHVNWRLALAGLLAKTDHISEAIHEARICLRLKPQFNAAEKLIEELSILPGAMEGGRQPLSDKQNLSLQGTSQR